MKVWGQNKIPGGEGHDKKINSFQNLYMISLSSSVQMSRRAVIVSTARTGLAKSFRGGFNGTHGAALGGHAIKAAIAKAGIDGERRLVTLNKCGLDSSCSHHVARTQLARSRTSSWGAGCRRASPA